MAFTTFGFFLSTGNRSAASGKCAHGRREQVVDSSDQQAVGAHNFVMSSVSTYLVLISLVPSRCVGHEVVYSTLSASTLVHSNEEVITNTTDTTTSSPVPFNLNVNENTSHFVPLLQLRLLFASFPHSSSLYCPVFYRKNQTRYTQNTRINNCHSCIVSNLLLRLVVGRKELHRARVDHLVAPEQVD